MLRCRDAAEASELFNAGKDVSHCRLVRLMMGEDWSAQFERAWPRTVGPWGGHTNPVGDSFDALPVRTSFNTFNLDSSSLPPAPPRAPFIV